MTTTQNSFTPKQVNGHLYYIRMNTPQGIFYKIGFTSMRSVIDRFSYKENEDYKLIDRILFFAYFEDAFTIECTLHEYFNEKRAFGKYSADQDMPLCRNGQSELYYEDVLELDNEFTEKQIQYTKNKVKFTRLRRVLHFQKLTTIAMSLSQFLDKIKNSLSKIFNIIYPSRSITTRKRNNKKIKQEEKNPEIIKILKLIQEKKLRNDN